MPSGRNTHPMPKPADLGGKRLISLAPDAWVQWVTQNPQAKGRAILASEFQWISRASDIVVRAHSPQIGEFLVLNELQLRYTPRMPQRMRNYAALAEERYKLPAYPVLVNILPPASSVEIATSYQTQFMGLIARQDYRVINLWEVNVELVWQQSLSPLLPFVPILRGGGTESAVRQALQALRDDEQMNELEPLLAFFASFVLEIPIVQQIMRWDMTVLRESPWYQEIWQQGRQQGRQQGIQQGRQQGIQQGMQRQLLRLLQIKFQSVPSDVQVTLQQLNVEQLEEALAIALAVNSLDELVECLPPISIEEQEP